MHRRALSAFFYTALTSSPRIRLLTLDTYRFVCLRCKAGWLTKQCQTTLFSAANSWHIRPRI
jgi:hypothetical protein